ncbi:MAG: aa3-type cytochrome c oxidase subunit IV [Sphingomonadaceae bacterium]|nr:aa3-type cytochrome c oxidase subunit IV [Sphingomonadaceae bacterium]
MAADHATDTNMKAHAKTYTGFLSVTKWSIIFTTIVLIGLFAFVFGE